MSLGRPPFLAHEPFFIQMPTTASERLTGRDGKCELNECHAFSVWALNVAFPHRAMEETFAGRQAAGLGCELVISAARLLYFRY